MPSDVLQTPKEFQAAAPSLKKPLSTTKPLPQEVTMTRKNLIECGSWIISDMIEERQTNYTNISQIHNKTSFHAQKLPSISIKDYMMRFETHSSCEDDVFVYALIYLDKIGELVPDFYLDSFNVHRTMLLCMVMAIKYNSDAYYKNSYYAKIGGVSIQEFNELEVDFLMNYIQFNLYVSAETYNDYLEDLKSYYQSRIEDS